MVRPENTSEHCAAVEASPDQSVAKTTNVGEADQTTAEEHICTTPGCGKVARMACPTCLQLNIPPSRFCDQTCFKSYWEEHKKLHADVRKTRVVAKVDPSQMPTEFKGFQFTGPLRPYQKTPRRTVPDHIPRPDYAMDPNGYPHSEIEERRTRKTLRVYSAAEIAGIRESCRIGREVLDIAGAAVRVGITCDELDRIVHEATIERNAYPSPLNYNLFPKSVCTSVNEVICHGIPDLRELQDGDIVNVDVSVYYNGYHADLNETFLVGNVSEDSVRVVKCAYESLGAAIDVVRPGNLYRDIGEAIGPVAKKAKCSIVTAFCGHGIGSLFHASGPDIPHYPKNKAKGTMAPGHIFTIEPMINLGVHRETFWPDDWTATTADGKRSAQFEHQMLVTETGVELLTARRGEPTDRIEWSREKFQR